MKIFKTIIFIISLFFFLNLFQSSYHLIIDSQIFNRNHLLLELLFLSIAYAFLLILVAISWKNLLENITKNKLSFSLNWMWLYSNIFKYLPGNIFNYISRQLMARKLGISHSQLIHSNITESILLSFAALQLSSFIIIENDAMYLIALQNYISLKYIGLLAIVLFTSIIYYLYIFQSIKVFNTILNISLYLGFFLGIGAIAYFILNMQMKIDYTYFSITAIYSFAWLIGFLVPGSPGGLGVRESAFVLLSNGVLTTNDAILLASLLRLISMFGELIVFIFSFYFLKYKYKVL